MISIGSCTLCPKAWSSSEAVLWRACKVFWAGPGADLGAQAHCSRNPHLWRRFLDRRPQLALSLIKEHLGSVQGNLSSTERLPGGTGVAPYTGGKPPEWHLTRLQRGLSTPWRVEMFCYSVPFSL